MSERADYWDSIYSTAPSATRSWYEREPSHSLRLVAKTGAGSSAAIVDVGSGTSMFVDQLLECGFTDVTLLDISGQALEQVRHRLGGRGGNASFIRHDVVSWEPDRQYDIWHDRAVFHFITEPSQRTMYVSLAEKAVRAGGALIVATFAEDGPTECSGLPVHRYSADELVDMFGAGFEPLYHERESHVTPVGLVQPFTWVLLRRRS